LLWSLATAAQAHLVASGLGPVYDGILSVMFSPQCLALGALGLYSGLQGPKHARCLCGALCIGWYGGNALAATNLTPSTACAPSTALLLLLAGGLLAAKPRLSVITCAVGAAVLGLSSGLDPACRPVSASLMVLLGAGAALFAVSALAASVTLPLKHPVLIIAARVVGSWVAASGLLQVGWLIHSGAMRS